MAFNSDSPTIKNIEAAFAGESMANRKYLFFARRARELGAIEVAEVFEKTAEQETAHAFGHLDLLYPKDQLTVETMLQMAIDGETYEYTEMYPGFAKTARDEGFEEVAEWFETLARAEKSHAGRFGKGLDSLKQ